MPLTMPFVKNACSSAQLQELWVLRILTEDDAWTSLTMDAIECCDLNCSPSVDDMKQTIKRLVEAMDYDDGIPYHCTYEQILEMAGESPDDIRDELNERRRELEEICGERFCLSEMAEANMFMLKSLYDLTDVEMKCLYWVMVHTQENDLQNLINIFDVREGGLALYAKLCSCAFALPLEEVEAAFAMNSKLLRLKIIHFNSGYVQDRLENWFRFMDEEICYTLTVVPYTRDEWLSRWVVPCTVQPSSLAVFDELDGLNSIAVPMLEEALASHRKNVHVLIRSKGKDLGRLLASHLAEALNALLVRPYEGEGSYVSTDCVRKAGRMVGNERCLFLCDWLSISPEELTNTVDGYEKPCIWLLDDHESMNTFPAFAVFDLVGMEDTIRQELLEKLTGKTFNARQRKSIAA